MLRKYALLDVLEAWRVPEGAPAQVIRKAAHRVRFEYVPRPGYLYVRARAISSRTNDNHDTFPAGEIEKSYRTFLGKPCFVNHHNSNHKRARGVIVAAALHRDRNPDGSPDVWVELLHEIDAVTFPRFAKAILSGRVNRTSMGVDCEYSTCSACGNRATSPVEYCQHMPGKKGMKFRRRNSRTGKLEEHMIHEICAGLTFFENSFLVEDPADPSAYVLDKPYLHPVTAALGPGIPSPTAETPYGQPEQEPGVHPWSYRGKPIFIPVDEEPLHEPRHAARRAPDLVAHFAAGRRYFDQPLYHGTRTPLAPGEVLTTEQAARHPNNPDIQADPYVHATTDPAEAHRWGERADSAQASRRAEELGRERRMPPGGNSDQQYPPRVYRVRPTGHVEPDLAYADTEHDSYRSPHPMRVLEEVRPLECYAPEHEGEMHWPDHPHYQYLKAEQDEEDEGRTAARTAAADDDIDAWLGSEPDPEGSDWREVRSPRAVTEWSKDTPYQAAIHVAQNRTAFDHPNMHTRLPEPEVKTSRFSFCHAAAPTIQHMLRAVGYPEDEIEGAYVLRHPDRTGSTSNPCHDSQGHVGVVLHPDRWDYGTMAHEVAHLRHIQEIAAPFNDQSRGDDDIHGDRFAHHYANALGVVSKGAGEDFRRHYANAKRLVSDYRARVHGLPRIDEAMEREAAANLPRGIRFHFLHADDSFEGGHKVSAHLPVRGGGHRQVGYVLWSPHEDGTVLNIDVHKKYRGRGIGTALVQRAQEEAAKRGLPAPADSDVKTPMGIDWWPGAWQRSPGVMPGQQELIGRPKGNETIADSAPPPQYADRRDHLIHEHGFADSAPIIRGLDDASVDKWHDAQHALDVGGVPRGQGQMHQHYAALEREAAPRYKTPEDHPFFQANPVSKDHIKAAWYDSTDDERDQGRHWYPDAHLVATAIAHGDSALGAGLLAAYSPRTNWPANMFHAARSIHEGRAMGSQKGDGPIMRMHWEPAQRMLNGEHHRDVLKGPKTRAFAHLIEHGGNSDEDIKAGTAQVVIDRHALSAAVGRRMTDDDVVSAPIDKPRYYHHVAQKYLDAADEVSTETGQRVTPEWMQATVWLRQIRKNHEEDSSVSRSFGGGGRMSLQRNDKARWEQYAREHHPELAEETMHAASLRRQGGDPPMRVPPAVDTLRPEACPVCGDQDVFKGQRCPVCGFVAPPDIFRDPDIDQARLNREQLEEGKEESPYPEGPADEEQIGSGQDADDQLFHPDQIAPDGVPGVQPDANVPGQGMLAPSGEDELAQPGELDENGQPVEGEEPELDENGQPAEGEEPEEEQLEGAGEEEEGQELEQAGEQEQEQGAEDEQEEEGEEEEGLPPRRRRASRADSVIPAREYDLGYDAEAEMQDWMNELRSGRPASPGKEQDEEDERPGGKMPKRTAELSAITAQQRAVDELRRENARLHAGLRFIAELAGVTSELDQLMRTADLANPAQPVPDPPQSPPTQSTEEALASGAPTGSGTGMHRGPGHTEDDPSRPGTTPGSLTAVPAEQTTTALTPGVEMQTPPATQLTDVTSPVQGTNPSQDGGVPIEQRRIETDVRIDPDPLKAQGPGIGGVGNDGTAFPWTVGARQVLASGPQSPEDERGARTFAAIRLAKLRITAGLARGDELEVATVLERDASLTLRDIEHEIATLTQVTRTAAQAQPRYPRGMAPRTAAKSAPSFAAEPVPAMAMTAGAIAGDNGDDSDLFM